MKQVYIADDNQEFASYIATVAKGEGWSVSLCPNGRELVEQVRSDDGPALLLVDINMPEMDGIEAIEGLSETSRQLRIRFMTGGSDTSIIAAKLIAQARNLTVGRSMFKPVYKKDLVELLKKEAEALTG